MTVRDDRIDLIGAPDPEASRLIIVSAGNVRGAVPHQMRTEEGTLDPLLLSDLSRIEEPAQAHNVLTVGACTHLDTVPDTPVFRGYRPLVVQGAAITKPDIVLEGGNMLVAPDESFLEQHELVSVATTHHDPARQLTLDERHQCCHRTGGSTDRHGDEYLPRLTPGGGPRLARPRSPMDVGHGRPGPFQEDRNSQTGQG